MKNERVTLGIIAFSFSLLVSCNNNSKDKASSTPNDTAAAKESIPTNESPAKEPEAAMLPTNQQDYQYEPSVSVITGTIITESFYGPPGYGEHPETDTKENPYLLTVEKPVNVISTAAKTDEDEDNPTVKNLSKIQLIYPDGVDMTKLLNKKVRLTGTFFHAHTGHHHTDILMDVQKVEEL